MSNTAKRLIDRFGAKSLAGWAGVSVVTVYRWSHARQRGGTGGFVPQAHWERIIRNAAKDGVKVGINDLAGIADVAIA
ncbi:hypothetical protein P7L68_19615 [Tistrella mobilis]|uniref:hypothetical protein n=1 Tax=Tistrella mobilis TaxID=171437 RepID=UPI003557E54D